MMRPLLFMFMFLPGLALAGDYADRDDVRAFIREMAGEGPFEEEELLSLFQDATYKQRIIDAISKSAEKTLSWAEYQDIFLKEGRRRAGISFMRDNRAVLSAAQDKYGVPPAIVAAIIGVETSYGRILGSYRVLDALTTLAFDYPPRAKFFRRELKEFILLAQEEKQAATELTGSYAGAMGMGQFMPSSYRMYAVDFDGDGFRDIWNNPTDAIGSVANYLYVHGWRKGGRITLEVVADGVPEDVFNLSLELSKSVGELRAMGMTGADLNAAEMVSPMRLNGKQGEEYWLGLHNFYVITRYNHSRLYAMAVFQLSEGLRTGSAGLGVR